MIQMSVFSQETSKTTSLTDKDTTTVKVKYRYIVATRMLYKDWCGEKKITNQQLYTIQTQERQISSLVKVNNLYKTNDSLSRKTISNDSILLINDRNQISDLTSKVRQEKTAKIIASVSVPVAAILGFLLGWTLHR